MNEDIATLVATRPEERKAQLTNRALNEYEAACARARAKILLSPAGLPSTPAAVRHRIHAQARELHVALARVGAVLARIEGPR